MDINSTDTLVAAVNRDKGTVSVINPVTSGEVSRTSGMPDARGVVFNPADPDMFFVVHRDGVTRISNAGNATPNVGTPLDVCAEPHGIAASPTGAKLFVACLDGYLAIVSNSSGNLTLADKIQLRNAAVTGGGNLPRNAAAMAVSVTDDGDTSDSNEKVVVPLFWYEPVSVNTPADVDLGGIGVVAVLDTNGVVQDRIDLMPEPDTGFGVGAFMNQLGAVATQTVGTAHKAYVLAMAASPKGPTNAVLADGGVGAGIGNQQNTHPYVLVLDLDTGAELERHNLNIYMAEKVKNTANTNPKRFASVLSGISLVPGSNIAYVTSIASDAMFRLSLNADGTRKTTEPTTGGFGTGRNNFITLGRAPSGLVVTNGVNTALTARAYVVHELDYNVQGVSFVEFALTGTPASMGQLPTAGSAEEKLLLGKRDFITSTGIWGRNGVVGCLACHPGNGALTDNVTWYFAAGPRQTIAMDGMFGRQTDTQPASSTNPKVKTNQRALNWTAIFDEMHDFELNTRGVSGGVGAIVRSTDAGFVSLELKDAGPTGGATANAEFLRNSAKDVVTRLSARKDWDFIDDYFTVVDSPRAPAGDSTAVAAGRQLFIDGNCASCHGGSKWTISRLPYDPTDNTGGTLAAERAANVSYTGRADNLDNRVIAGDDTDGGVVGGINPSLRRIACVLRNVDTFRHKDGGVDNFEVRQNMGATNTAQGVRGYNPPSLLGVRYGAPYLHDGEARTLTDLFDPRFDGHTLAGNINFLATGDRATQVANLVAFLESIDSETAPIAPVSGDIYCPAVP